jgi:hypothetical protein
MEIARAEQKIGRSLPLDMQAFYLEINGLSISWEHRDQRWSEFGANGTLHFFSLEAISSSHWNEVGPDHKTVLPFDWPSDEYYAGLSRESDSIHWVYDTESEDESMGVSFTSYLEAALECRGWTYWQQMFLYDGTGYLSTQTEGRMQSVLPMLFARFDIEKLGRAKHCPPYDTSVLEAPAPPEPILVYTPRHLPAFFTEGLPEDSPLWDRLFWIAGKGLSESILSDLPEEGLQEGIDFANRVARLLRVYQLDEILNPSDDRWGRVLMGLDTLSLGMHAGDRNEMEVRLRDSGYKLVPVRELLQHISYISLKNTSGKGLRTAQTRSLDRPYNSRQTLRNEEGVFVVDRRESDYEHFMLYGGGLNYSGPEPGPGEECMELRLKDLAAGNVTELQFSGDVQSSEEETLVIGLAENLPAGFGESLSKEYKSCLFWLAPRSSQVISALDEAGIPERTLGGAAAAMRLCDQLEDVASEVSPMQAGYHSGEGQLVEAWLRSQECQITELSAFLLKHARHR